MKMSSSRLSECKANWCDVTPHCRRAGMDHAEEIRDASLDISVPGSIPRSETPRRRGWQFAAPKSDKGLSIFGFRRIRVPLAACLPVTLAWDWRELKDPRSPTIRILSTPIF